MSILGKDIPESIEGFDINNVDVLKKKADEVRGYIDRLHKEKDKFASQSQDCYKNDKSEEAKHLSDKVNRCQVEIDYFGKKLAELIFRSNQMKIEDYRLIDVRGLFVKDAIEKIEKRVSHLKDSGDLAVIVGTSGDNLSKLGDGVKSHLDSKKIKNEPNQPTKGRILIHLSGNSSSIDESAIKDENKITNDKLPKSDLMNENERKEYLEKKNKLLAEGEKYRNDANKCGDEMDKLYKQAEEAYKNNDKDKNKSLRDQAAKKNEEMKKLNEKASECYYKANNLLNDKFTLDLHGQYVNEAMLLVEKRFKEINYKGDIVVIVGAGHHSENNVRKIKPKFEEYLKENNFKYEDNVPNGGCMTIHLDGKAASKPYKDENENGDKKPNPVSDKPAVKSESKPQANSTSANATTTAPKSQEVSKPEASETKKEEKTKNSCCIVM